MNREQRIRQLEQEIAANLAEDANAPQQKLPWGWRVRRNPDGTIGLFSPTPRSFESQRTSECFYASDRTGRGELLFRFLSDILAEDEKARLSAIGQRASNIEGAGPELRAAMSQAESSLRYRLAVTEECLKKAQDAALHAQEAAARANARAFDAIDRLEASKVTVPADMIERLTNSIAWLRDGDRKGPGVGLGDFITLHAALTAKPVGQDRVRAKPLQWQENGSDWLDSRYGYYISFDPEDSETPYHAAQGESDGESFATLQAAQEWCQADIDRWIAQHAIVDHEPPASEPVFHLRSYGDVTADELQQWVDNGKIAGKPVIECFGDCRVGDPLKCSSPCNFEGRQKASAPQASETSGNPPIPIRPCFRCGVPTCETYSVHGVGHDACFRLGPIKTASEPAEPAAGEVAEDIVRDAEAPTRPGIDRIRAARAEAREDPRAESEFWFVLMVNMLLDEHDAKWRAAIAASKGA